MKMGKSKKITEKKLFADQTDIAAVIDPTTRTLELSVVTEKARDGVLVTITESVYDSIHNFIYGERMESLDLDIEKIIQSAECINTGESLYINENIKRSTKQAIDRLLGEFTDIAEDINSRI